MTVVVVESPAKAKTINKYLGSDYRVLASYGHVRDLPSKDGSVDPDHDFRMSWSTNPRSAKHIAAIADALKSSQKLVLATDPDREGEAISWHVLEVLQKRGALKDKAVERVVFNAVTRKAVLDAVANPRQLDKSLVEAYLARRALDYLVGFTLSPVLWRKLPGARSAGRVQSVALRLVCDREHEIETFEPREYWTIESLMRKATGEVFPAQLRRIGEKKLGAYDIASADEARAIEEALKDAEFSVDALETKPVQRHPFPPFTTSTLQQEASRKLKFSAQHTMRIAQQLYEGMELGGESAGLITYMRTDGVQIAPEAISAVRNVVSASFGSRYLPRHPRRHTAKIRNAQEAHEAIRPTDISRHPDELGKLLPKDHHLLYTLIWRRTLASQMASAEFERTQADLGAQGHDGQHYLLRATGQVRRFDGFLRLYQAETQDEQDQSTKVLPALTHGEKLRAESLSGVQHFTEPPPRYSEATLIKKMEEIGIGRPSTYTAILSVLRERDYVQVEKNRLRPQDKGRLVTAFLDAFFHRYIEYDFTADLESQLDQVSSGGLVWKTLLSDFWQAFSRQVDEVKELRVAQVLDALNVALAPLLFERDENGALVQSCPSCEDGRLSLKIGKFGAFIGCANYPACRYTRQIGDAAAGNDQSNDGVVLLGHDPQSGKPITRQTGRFGAYVQREAADGGKPQRASIPAEFDPQTLELELALKLLSLPRQIGVYPETGSPVTAGIGRYGPYVAHERTYVKLPKAGDVFTIGLNRAVDLIAGKASRARAGTTAQVLRDLGEHPRLGGPLEVRTGRYGPYIRHGKVNASLPRGVDVQDITPDQAVALIDAKAQQPARAKRSRKKTGSPAS